MNPTFSFILVLLLVTVSIAQKKSKDKGKVSHSEMEGDWILEKCSGTVEETKVPKIGVRFAYSKNAIADSDLVLWKQKTGDGVLDGAITASRSRKPSHNSWAKVVEEAKKEKKFQALMVSIGNKVTSVDMKSKDEFVINYKYKDLKPKCTYKRSPEKFN